MFWVCFRNYFYISTFFLFFCTSEFLCPIRIDLVGMAEKANIDGAVVKEMVEIF